MASQWRLFATIGMLAIGQPLAAQTTDDELASRKAESETRKLEADARKAEAEANQKEAESKAASIKAQLGGLADVGTEGNTSATNGAGTIEASILAADAARVLATRIVDDVCQVDALCKEPTAVATKVASIGASDAVETPSDQRTPPTVCDDLAAVSPRTPPKLYIMPEAEKLSFDAAEVVQSSLCGLKRKLDTALIDSELIELRQSQSAGLTTLFTLANVGAKLFRSDYAFQGVTITPDDMLLVKLFLAEARTRVKLPMMVPSLYREAALHTSNPLAAAVTQLSATRDKAASEASKRRAEAAQLGKKKSSAAAAKKRNDVASNLETAVKAFDDYLAKITTPSDKGVVELAEAARQARIRQDLASGSYLLSLKMNAAGGTGYTKKNFWTFLGGAPFYVSGGAVTSYALIEGNSGAVRVAGSFGTGSMFERIGALHGN